MAGDTEGTRRGEMEFGMDRGRKVERGGGEKHRGEGE